MIAPAAGPAEGPVAIHTGRLVLRDFVDDDVEGVAGLVGDDQVTVWLSFDRRTRDEAAAMLNGILERQHASPRTEYYLAITPAEDTATVAGFIRLGLGGHKAADLGYALRPDWQGRGYAREAAAAMIEFAFEKVGLHRLTANIGPANEASQRLVKSLWFTYEGTIRDHVFTNGAWRDSRSYSLLAHEWANAPTCGYCGRRIPAPTSPGRTPKFCSTAHRQAAYRANQSTS
ncbi:GNAT family N-acetyltransferase [Nocardioides luteus]|uniref:GNAT family N-acetyltransferase n=1 Tax=Nocardioides luteus TaxID=1844 RepID=UPI0018C92738|nr:GNAT family protein [Nocardioides luteus]MBG6099071.1 RimJ/RimL family protein N-acetyltransferase [Nocardioides luteus]